MHTHTAPVALGVGNGLLQPLLDAFKCGAHRVSMLDVQHMARPAMFNGRLDIGQASANARMTGLIGPARNGSDRIWESDVKREERTKNRIIA